ncbi:Ig kappa chain V region EV15 [Heterocephalus glaber]|nr:Ig kappa chain V region EV15 [Heterocephalus glaber]
MGPQAQLLSFFLLWISADCLAGPILTQFPALLSGASGDKVTITCKASTDINDDMYWYQQKPGETPKLLIKEATTLISSQFSGSGYGTDFTLKINAMKSEDVTYYF